MKITNNFVKQGLPFGMMTYVISQLISNIFNGFSLLPLFGTFFVDIGFIMGLALLYTLYLAITKR